MSELSRDQQKYLHQIVREHREFLREHKATTEERINYWKSYIRQALTEYTKNEGEYLAELYRKELAIDDGTFDDKYGLSDDSEGQPSEHSISEKLVWSGKKIHLIELIMALHLWEGIKDQNGNIATQGQLVDLFNSMFTFTGAKPIDEKGLSGQILQYYETNKVAFDNKIFLENLDSIFISELKKLIIKNKEERLEKKYNK